MDGDGAQRRPRHPAPRTAANRRDHRPRELHGLAQVGPGGPGDIAAETEAATISCGDDIRVTRIDLIARTRSLIDEGERLGVESRR